MVRVFWATHVLHRQKQRVAKNQFFANLQKLSQSRLFSVIRKYEDEIVSNRKLVRYGEWLIKFCTHRPSRSEH